jgi:hypothetical protein
MDMIDEDIVGPQEVLDSINEAARMIGKEILDLYEDYFLKRQAYNMTVGQTIFPLPTDIFAGKIRRINYCNGATQYKVERINGLTKGQDAFEIIDQVNLVGLGDWYRYIILNNDPSTGMQINLFPPSRDTLTGALSPPTGIIISYIREVNKVVVNSDIVDIPEGYDFIVAYGKWKCAIHEGNDTRIKKAEDEVELQRKSLMDTLATMVPDSDNIIQGDYSTYLEHS